MVAWSGHITTGTAGLLGALFFLGYFFFQIPAAHYAETRSVKRAAHTCRNDAAGAGAGAP